MLGDMDPPGAPSGDSARQAPPDRGPSAGRVGRGTFPSADRVPPAGSHPATELRNVAHGLDDLGAEERSAPRPSGIVGPLVSVGGTIIIALIIAGGFLIGPPSAR